MIPVRCPKCRTEMDAEDSLAGQRVDCPACRSVRAILVPKRVQAVSAPRYKRPDMVRPCPACGNEASKQARTCPSCGHRLKSVALSGLMGACAVVFLLWGLIYTPFLLVGLVFAVISLLAR